MSHFLYTAQNAQFQKEKKNEISKGKEMQHACMQALFIVDFITFEHILIAKKFKGEYLTSHH